MTSRLVASLEGLQGRKLTPDELHKIQSFQKLYQVDDDDPLLVVLAMMANSQLVLESAPTLLQAEVAKTIEHHRTNLREQAVLISKDLIAVVSQQLRDASAPAKGKHLHMYAACFFGGVVFTGVLQYLFTHHLR